MKRVIGMKRLIGLSAVVAVLLAIPASHILWGKAHVLQAVPNG